MLMHILLFFSNILIVIRRLLFFSESARELLVVLFWLVQAFIAFSIALARRLHRSVILYPLKSDAVTDSCVVIPALSALFIYDDNIRLIASLLQ